MKIGILSDAHGNEIGLLACLKYFEKEKIKKIIYLGDSIDYFPAFDQVNSLLEQKAQVRLLGNHDIGFSSLLPFKGICILGKKLLFVHGSPWDPLNEYIYPNADLTDFKKLDYDAVFMGHTHRPFIKKIGQKLIVNVGSCGQPRDYGIMSSCAVYNLKNNLVKIIRIPMDMDKMMTKYGSKIDISTKNCLKRTTAELVGEVVKV